MVLQYYKLREQPFGVTPDPRYLFASSTHREALASLIYGIDSGLGFVTLTANPGMGKTTLLFEVLRRLSDSTKTAFIFQTVTTPDELVRALLIDLGVKEVKPTLVEMQAQLNELLIAESTAGKRLVVAIDEAQNLNESVLEAVRMLSNFETASRKLMQIILAGQLQLAEVLASPKMLQLRQRISIFSHLKPLSPTEANAYVQHRLAVSGYDSPIQLFTPSAMDLIARQSGGIPRNINNICFNALSIGCALQKKTIDVDVIREVLGDLDVGHIRNLANQNQRPRIEQPRIELPRIERSRIEQPQIEQPQIEQQPWIEQPRPPIMSHTVPVRSLSSPATRSASQKQWKAKLLGITATACLTALLLAWFGVKEYRAVPAEATATGAPEPVSSVAPNPDQKPVTGAAPDPGQTSAPNTAAVAPPAIPKNTPTDSTVRWVVVKNGQSLFSICVEYFGSCRPDTWNKIMMMNTSIPDPDSVHSGQRIAIPARTHAANEGNSQMRAETAPTRKEAVQ